MDLSKSVKNTADHSTSYRKTLLYAFHGWGKTTQMKYFQEAYGPGFIISGESGLSSIRSAGIEYLPFTSWNGETNSDKDLYSFRDIFRYVRSDKFKAKNYAWIGVDSLTELADMALKASKSDAEAKCAAKLADGQADAKVDGFVIWGEYATTMLGVCKGIRDLPMHVIVTALAKESQNNDGENEYWPMIAGKQVQTQLPGIFDCVLCGVRAAKKDLTTGDMLVERYVVTDETRGWHGKVRDEMRVLKSVEQEGDITKLFARMDPLTKP